MLRQRDTYFRARSGRLKLREEEPGGAVLIQYDRPDAADARESRYRLTRVQDPDDLRASLDAALGTLVVVDKERHLLLWDGVRIHLDTVDGLGSFVELEGVAPPESDLGPEREKVARLQRELGIERGPHRLLLGPPARRRRADRRRARGDGARARAVLALPRRRRAARRGRLDPRRRQRRELGLPAGAVRRGVGDRRARRRRPHARARGGRDRRLGRDLRPVRRLPPAAARVHAARRHVHLCSAAGERRTATLEELLPMSFGPEFLPHERPHRRPRPAAGHHPRLRPRRRRRRARGRRDDPLHRAARLPGAERPRPRRHARARHAVRPAGRRACRAAGTSTRAATRAPCAARCAR